MTEIEVRHNPEASRFESEVDGGIAFVTYTIDGDKMTLTHTEVPKEAEGKGVAGNLVAAAVTYARAAKLRIVPKCPYAAGWMKRHREHDDVLHPEYRLT